MMRMPSGPAQGRPRSVGNPVLQHLGGGSAVLGSFHEGGEVLKDGAYELKKGEQVIPTTGDGKRDSEYRRVYLGRKKKK